MNYMRYYERAKRCIASWKRPQHFESLKSAHVVANGAMWCVAHMCA